MDPRRRHREWSNPRRHRPLWLIEMCRLSSLNDPSGRRNLLPKTVSYLPTVALCRAVGVAFQILLGF